MKKDISADKPITKREEDRLQRYGFAQRIASTIIQRGSSEGIVISLNGRWGEGKTSVLNLIESELNKEDDFIIIKFNPWRYEDEEALIKNFLKKVADSLGRELENRKEKLGEFISKYGSFTTIIGANIAEIGKSLNDTGLEVLKDRIDEFLEISRKKLVVFVDDIDRLDKNEIFSLFKLVKLTGDFKNTTYILSFDEDMVASAIGENFGKGNIEAGRSFLEKIIQIPLKLPQAQVSALKNYCFSLIDKAIEKAEISIKIDDARTFASEFSNNILIRLKSPRLAIRYSNSLAFAFPLLKGEVNPVDLMLIEAVKIFYPHHYELIKSSPHLFTISYSSDPYYTIGSNAKERKQELEAQLEKLSSDYTRIEMEAILSLLKFLFPILNEAFHNRFEHNGGEKWYKGKRIVSPSYFNRFFTYSVIEGELSDVQFENFMFSLEQLTILETTDYISKTISDSSVDAFIRKSRTFEDKLPWESAKKLIKALASLTPTFPNNQSFFGFGGPRSQTCIFIVHFIQKHENYEQILDLIRDLLEKDSELKFAFDLFYWLRADNTAGEKIISEKEEKELFQLIVKRTLVESVNEPVFQKFPGSSWDFFKVWTELNGEEAKEYVTNILEESPKHSLTFIKSLTSSIRSLGETESYKIDLNKDNYDFITSIVDENFLRAQIIEAYGEEIFLEKAEFFDREDKQTDINILRQFEHWYHKALSTREIL